MTYKEWLAVTVLALVAAVSFAAANNFWQIAKPDFSGMSDEDMHNEFTRKYGIADSLNDGEPIGRENEVYIECYIAECKRRGIWSGFEENVPVVDLEA